MSRVKDQYWEEMMAVHDERDADYDFIEDTEANRFRLGTMLGNYLTVTDKKTGITKLMEPRLKMEKETAVE